jgi:hypothetical protein
LRIDLVALGQRLIQVHRTQHGADIGHHQVEDGDFQLRDFVCGLGRIEHLEEHHAIDLHHRVVLGDDLLRGHVQHLFHHVDLAADAVT